EGIRQSAHLHPQPSRLDECERSGARPPRLEEVPRVVEGLVDADRLHRADSFWKARCGLLLGEREPELVAEHGPRLRRLAAPSRLLLLGSARAGPPTARALRRLLRGAPG